MWRHFNNLYFSMIYICIVCIFHNYGYSSYSTKAFFVNISLFLICAHFESCGPWFGFLKTKVAVACSSCYFCVAASMLPADSSC